MRFLKWTMGWSAAVMEDTCEVTDQRNLTSSKDAALKELRNRVNYRLPPHLNSDEELLRWLRARNFDVDQAEKMLLKSLEWREEWQVDNILEWTPPEVMSLYYPASFCGYDKEGSPVWIISYGNCDVRGLLLSCHRRDYIKFTIQKLEKSLKIMKERSEELGTKIAYQNGIFDLENFSIKHITCKPAMEVVLQIVQLYEANYPEILKCAYVINAPKIFMTAYALIKPFLHEVTLSKIRIFGRTGWKEAILENISPDQLPVNWGGTLCDPDGNTKCPSKLILGGEVPKSFYMKKKQAETSRLKSDNLKTIVLPKGGRKVIELVVNEPMSKIRWEFQSEYYDIGFAIYRLLKSGEEQEVIPYQRVNSQLTPEDGTLTCSDCGTYRVLFDNEYSYIRAKTVQYDLQLLPPNGQEQS